MDNNIDYKKIIKEEYFKCSQDPEHFMRKYCFIQHPTRGRVIFNLYPFQGKVLNLFKHNKKCFVLKSRQLGISTLVAGYTLWLMLFHSDKNILCIATKQDTAKNMVTKVKFMYNNLPSWLKERNTDGSYKKPLEESKLTLKLNNGSQVKATSAASDAGRSEAVSLLIIDEAAFIEDIEEIWASAQQTLSTGGECIVLSTPFGTGNWFHRMWLKAEAGENDFLPIKLKWNVHPERDQKWRDEQDTELGDPRKAAQECDAEFNTSGDTVFYNELIDLYLQTFVQEPIEKRGLEQNYWIWEYPDYSRNYMVVADVARGDGSDYSAFHVIDIETNTQVAEFKGQLGASDFGRFLVQVAIEWNNALLVCENENIGWSTIESIQNLDYKNMFYSPKSGDITLSSYTSNNYYDPSKMVPGFSTHKGNRGLVVGKFIEFVNARLFIIKSKRLIEEMKVFIWKNGRAEAQSGYNDDLIMCGAIGMYIRDTALKFKQQGLELTKATLNGISSTRASGAYNISSISNPYLMNVNGKKEDYSWIFNK